MLPGIRVIVLFAACFFFVFVFVFAAPSGRCRMGLLGGGEWVKPCSGFFFWFVWSGSPLVEILDAHNCNCLSRPHRLVNSTLAESLFLQEESGFVFLTCNKERNPNNVQPMFSVVTAVFLSKQNTATMGLCIVGCYQIISNVTFQWIKEAFIAQSVTNSPDRGFHEISLVRSQATRSPTLSPPQLWQR